MERSGKMQINHENGIKKTATPKISTSLWDPLGCSDLSQIFFGSSSLELQNTEKYKSMKQAGAELGQAQLKLGLGFTSTNLH